MESSPMIWKWIAEKIVDLSSSNVPLANEMITQMVPDLEEHPPLLERAGLRNLEDLVIREEIDDRAIVLLKELAKDDLEAPGTSTGFSSKQLWLKELILRVQTEVVLSVLRIDVDEEETPNWPCFEEALEKVFEDADKDNRLLDRKRELSALLKSKNRTKAIIAAYLEKYSFSKLRNDLLQYIKERNESFPTTFLDQLSRDFLDFNGRLFADDVKSAASRKPEDVGHNTAVDQSRDQHIGHAVITGKKRLRRKSLPTHDGPMESEKADEGSSGMKKPRISPSMPFVKPLLRQGVPELAVPASRPQEIESCEHLSSSNRSEERRNVDPEVMRSCSPSADKSISMEGITVSRRKNKYIVVSDVDSDADTEVAKTLSGDNEGSGRMKSGGDKHIIEETQSLSENGDSRIIVEAEASNKRKILADGKEASTSSPEAEVSQEESEKFVDSQDIHKVDYKDIGRDGYEEFCHLCEGGGELVCCDGCPIAMHSKCILGLGMILDEGDFFCPVCVSLMAARRAAEAEKAAVAAKEAAVVAKEAAAAAKEKLKALKRESKLNGRSSGGSATPRPRQEKAVKRSRRRSSGENDRSLKPKQLSDDEPTLSDKEGHQDPQPTILRIEYLPEHLVPENKSESLGVASVEQGKDATTDGPVLRVSASHSRVSVNVSAKSASPKLDVVKVPRVPQPSEEGSRRMAEQTAPTSEMRISDEENAERVRAGAPDEGNAEQVRAGVPNEENTEQVRAGVPDPGNRAGSRGEVEDDEGDDNDFAEDRGENRNQAKAALFSGRYKLPGVRRIRLPWTRQEEHVLKEGVRRFSNNGTWGFQWKRIREFGQGTFDPSRTEVDLKDKWRNLVRAVS